jgi:hypothetical protein
MESEESALTESAAKVMGTPSTQREAKPGEVEVFPPSDRGGITVIPLTAALKGMRQITSDAAMALLCSHASRLEGDLLEARKENVILQKKSESWMESFYKERERSSVLSVAQRADSTKGKIQKAVGTIGGIMAGAGIPFLVTGPIGFGLAGVIFGVALLIVGYLPPSRTKISDDTSPSI